MTASYANTPQAVDDSFGFLEDQLGLAKFGSNVLLDVMANDSGGKAKTLYSVDDGSGNPLSAADLLNADTLVNGISAWEVSASGNRVRINNGKIELDLSHTLSGLGASNINALAAGDVIHDSVIYAIRLGNGTISWAHVSFTVQGQNDGATISGDASGTTSEDAILPAVGVLVVSDPDRGESHTQAVNNGATAQGLGTYSIGADGHWSYTVNNALVQHLAAGATATDSFLVTSLDGTATQEVVVTINGVNDGPTAGADSASAAEDSVPVLGSVAGNDGDVDDGAVLSYQLVNAVAGLTLNADGSYAFNPSDAAYQYLASGETLDVVADYAVADEHGTLAGSTLTITVIGTNDAPSVTSGPATGSVSEVPLEATLFSDNFNRPDSDNLGPNWNELIENTTEFNDYLGRHIGPAFAHVESGELQLTALLHSQRVGSQFYNASGDGPLLTAELNQEVVNEKVTFDFDYKPGVDESPGPFIGLMNSNAGFIDVLDPNETLPDDDRQQAFYPVSGIGIVMVRSDSHSNNSQVWITLFDGSPTGQQIPFGDPGFLPFQLDSGNAYHFHVEIQSGDQVSVTVQNGINSFTFSESIGTLGFSLDQLYIVGGAGISYGTPGLLENTNSLDNIQVVMEGTGGLLSTDGTIIIEDADIGDQHTITVVPEESGYFGSFAFVLDDTDSQGQGSIDWTFEVQNLDVAFLTSEESLVQTYNVQIDDGHGGVVTQAVVVTINGADEFIA